MKLFKYIFRELSNNHKFSILFVLNLAMGLAGFIALDGFKVSLDQTIKAKSKVLLGADFGVSARRAITDDEKKTVLKNVTNKATLKKIEQTNMVEVFSMVSNLNKKTRLIQIRAIEYDYPFYGKVELQRNKLNQTEAHKNLSDSLKLWVHPEVLGQLNVKVGDSLKVGSAIFEIADVVTSDSASGFTSSVAPRIYMSLENLKATELIKVGSLAWYTVFYKIPNLDNMQLTELRDKVFEQIESPELQIYTHEKASEQMAGLLTILNDFLGLASLVALFLSAIGTVFLVRSYFSLKVDQIAILISLGLTPKLASGFYLIQIFVLGFVSSLVASLVALLIVPVIGSLTQGLLPFEISFIIKPSTFLLGVLIGSLGSALICLPLSLNLIHIKPIRLLSKDQVNVNHSTLLTLGYSLPALLFFWFLAVQLSNSFKIGSMFALIFIFSGLFLFLLSFLIFRPMKSFSSINNLSLRWALREITRDKITTATCFVSVGIGVLLLNLLPQVQKSVQDDLKNPLDSKIPSFFMFDIQEEQVDPLIEIIKNQKAELRQVSPTIQARLIEVNGNDFSKKIDFKKNQQKLSREQEQELRSRNRGFNLSYKDKLDASETILEGKPFSGQFDESKTAEISLEKRFAQRLGLKINDRMTFEIDGIPIEGVVVNLRSIKWSSFQPNFFIQFQPGALDLAPKTFVATVNTSDAESKLRLQDSVVEAHPNISMIDVSRVIERIVQITDQMVWALQFMSLLCFLAGFVVIYSIANHQATIKKWDIGLLKSLGASFRTIQNQFLWQFIIISFLASMVGLMISFLVSFLISNFIFENTWTLDSTPAILSLVGSLIVSVIVTLMAINKSLKTKTVDLFSE